MIGFLKDDDWLTTCGNDEEFGQRIVQYGINFEVVVDSHLQASHDGDGRK